MKKILLSSIVFLLLAAACFPESAALNSAYTYDYTQPPEFQPSFKSQFTALSNSVTDVFANPAGIMHVNTLEVALGLSGFVQNPIRSDENTIYVDDANMGGIKDSPNSRAYVRMTDDRSAITAESRPLVISEDYSKGGGVNYFGMTYKVADWLAFSVSRKRPTAISFYYQLLTPIMIDAQTNFRGTSVEANGTGVFIRADGTVEVRVGGVPFSTSEAPAWSGFLQQGTSEVYELNGTFANSIVNHNGVVITTAVKTGQVNWGLNIIPETIDLELNNEAYLSSNGNNTNTWVSLPNFGSTSEEVIAWATKECTLPSGYHTLSVESLAGEQIASAKIAGKYSASTVRMDLGMQWEPTDFFSVGAVYENFNNASIKLEGVLYSHVSHRLDQTSKMPTEESASYWNPFLTQEAHEEETEETIRNTLTMQTIELPRKLRFGAALKKPFLMAIDWEQWQNEYKFSSDPGHPETAHNIIISNISFLRLGMESQIMFLPMIIRGSITGLLKPTTNDKDVQKSLDDMFESIPVVPVDGNLYFGFGVLDGEFGFGFGGGGLPLIQAVMLDMSSIVKIFYSNVYFKKGDWQISYMYTVDPVLTAFSSDVSTSPGSDTTVNLMSTSTLSIGFKF